MLTDVTWQFSESAGALGPFERSVCIFNAQFFFFGCCSCTEFVFLRLLVWRAGADLGGAALGSVCGVSVSQGASAEVSNVAAGRDSCPLTVLPWWLGGADHHGLSLLGVSQGSILCRPQQVAIPPPLGSAAWPRGN